MGAPEHHDAAWRAHPWLRATSSAVAALLRRRCAIRIQAWARGCRWRRALAAVLVRVAVGAEDWAALDWCEIADQIRDEMAEKAAAVRRLAALSSIISAAQFGRSTGVLGEGEDQATAADKRGPVPVLVKRADETFVVLEVCKAEAARPVATPARQRQPEGPLHDWSQVEAELLRLTEHRGAPHRTDHGSCKAMLLIKATSLVKAVEVVHTACDAGDGSPANARRLGSSAAASEPQTEHVKQLLQQEHDLVERLRAQKHLKYALQEELASVSAVGIQAAVRRWQSRSPERSPEPFPQQSHSTRAELKPPSCPVLGLARVSSGGLMASLQTDRNTSDMFGRRKARTTQPSPWHASGEPSHWRRSPHWPEARAPQPSPKAGTGDAPQPARPSSTLNLWCRPPLNRVVAPLTAPRSQVPNRVKGIGCYNNIPRREEHCRRYPAILVQAAMRGHLARLQLHSQLEREEARMVGELRRKEADLKAKLVREKLDIAKAIAAKERVEARVAARTSGRDPVAARVTATLTPATLNGRRRVAAAAAAKRTDEAARATAVAAAAEAEAHETKLSAALAAAAARREAAVAAKAGAAAARAEAELAILREHAEHAVAADVQEAAVTSVAKAMVAAKEAALADVLAAQAVQGAQGAAAARGAAEAAFRRESGQHKVRLAAKVAARMEGRRAAACKVQAAMRGKLVRRRLAAGRRVLAAMEATANATRDGAEWFVDTDGVKLTSWSRENPLVDKSDHQWFVDVHGAIWCRGAGEDWAIFHMAQQGQSVGGGQSVAHPSRVLHVSGFTGVLQYLNAKYVLSGKHAGRPTYSKPAEDLHLYHAFGSWRFVPSYPCFVFQWPLKNNLGLNFRFNDKFTPALDECHACIDIENHFELPEGVHLWKVYDDINEVHAVPPPSLAFLCLPGACLAGYSRSQSPVWADSRFSTSLSRQLTTPLPQDWVLLELTLMLAPADSVAAVATAPGSPGSIALFDKAASPRPEATFGTPPSAHPPEV
jgi:hypothetical protein